MSGEQQSDDGGDTTGRPDALFPISYSAGRADNAWFVRPVALFGAALGLSTLIETTAFIAPQMLYTGWGGLVDAVRRDGLPRIATLGVALLSCCSAATLGVAGVACLSDRRRARHWLIAASAGLGGAMILQRLLYWAFELFGVRSMVVNDLPPLLRVFVALQELGGLLERLILPALLIWFMTRPSAREGLNPT